MIAASRAHTLISRHFQQADTLPPAQLRRLGLIYSSYRFIISLFFLLMSYAAITDNDRLLLPSFLQQTALIFYVVLSLILLGLFYIVPSNQRRQLAFGLALDIVILSLLLYTNGAPVLQLTMLYTVVVAASFMLLHGTQALIVTLMAIIFVIYQQFFYAITNSMSLTNLGNALLISASFLAVGFLSWTLTQRLVNVEKMAASQAKEVEHLNAINQQVISQMINGVIVVDRQHIVLFNKATCHLLGITESAPVWLAAQKQASNVSKHNEQKNESITSSSSTPLISSSHNDSLSHFQQQLTELHAPLIESCLAVPSGQSRTFTYELPMSASTSITTRLRVQTIPLKDDSRLIFLEDLSREQASAQQLKLASLGQLTASIAHEVRNPLAAISQASQLLMEEINELNDQHNDAHLHTPRHTHASSDNHELYQMIFEQTKRVDRIIEDVLKLSRQKLPQQQVITLADWMPQFLDNFFREHDVFLHLHAQPTISFDTHQLEQIFINLINNGLRYSSYAHPHAYVEIEIYRINNDVIIDVLDIGAGVRSEDLEYLFDPFFTTSQSGTGLGLYLSQAFCEANHARLLYIAEHEKTCFRLIMPEAFMVNTK